MALKPNQPKSGHLRGQDRNPTKRRGSDDGKTLRSRVGGVSSRGSDRYQPVARPEKGSRSFVHDAPPGAARGFVRRDTNQVTDPSASKRRKA
jgi:hypothetical protein